MFGGAINRGMDKTSGDGNGCDKFTFSWKRRSKTERALLIITFSAVVLALLLLNVVLFKYAKSHGFCLRRTCIRSANNLLSTMDTVASPCDDFYHFACGNFLKTTTMGERDIETVRSLTSKSIEDEINSIIETPASDADPAVLKMIKAYFKACTNEDAIEARSVATLRDALKSVGGWPLLEGNNWLEGGFEWKQAIYKLKTLGYNYNQFIDIGVYLNDGNTFVLELKEPSEFDLPLSEDNEKLYLQYMVNIAIHLGSERGRARSGFIDVIEFEKKLLKAIRSGRNTQLSFNPLSISELQYEFQEFPWFEYISRLLEQDTKITGDQEVTVPTPEYFKILFDLLKDTSNRTLANYISWKVVQQAIPYIDKTARNIKQQFENSLKNEYKGEDRIKDCFDLVHSKFSYPLLSLYMERHFDVGEFRHIDFMFTTIKGAFSEVLKHLEWLDEDTKKRARYKLSKITTTIDLKKKSPIIGDDFDLKIHEKEFLSSYLSINWFESREKFRVVQETYNKDNWRHVWLSEDLTSGNSILRVYPLFINERFYHHEQPKYSNFGALGFYLGRQLFALLFNSDDDDWLSVGSRLNFHAHLKCISDQYGAQLVPKVNVYLNSTRTKYEDLADLAGLKLAYHAYDLLEEEDEFLPGINYTPKQLFWISFASTQCSKYSVEGLKLELKYGGKSPGKYRVLGAVNNLKELSVDFHCLEGLRNNHQRCDLW